MKIKIRILLLVSIVLSTNFILAQDRPVSCENAVTPFNDLMKGRIISQVRTAHQYFMNSPDAGAGKDYTERTNNLQKEITRTFEAFILARKSEYKKTICRYYKTDWNKAGESSNRTLTVQPGFYLLTDSLKRTKNGDWKGGPNWKPNKNFPTSITWSTGGHRRNETFVDIKAVYKDDFIEKMILSELNAVRKELHELGIPTELPPLLK
ncbi:hypothetical protein [Gynurincola endophyticus]|uniref:hypothetical protein n=1 Tax=Gynurincola endophyticus TaxID=2479004 RepID=UPI000F8E7C70|nr:hypothetical protein [Gynurincola endophyticus]